MPTTPAHASHDTGILHGLRVLDLATGLAGSAAALQLSEAGAEVLKILISQSGLDRTMPPWSVLDRGKTRLPLDLMATQGRAQLAGLLAGADVLIHDLTPAQARVCGLSDAELSSKHPLLIVSAIGGWPQRHTLANQPVDETLVMARLGVLDEQPGHRRGPIYLRMPFASWVAAWLCAVGVLARLLARERDGRGGRAHTSLAQAALVPMAMHWARAETPTPAFAKGLDKNVPIPLHPCSDGRWIHVHYSPDAAPWMAEGLAALGPEGVARANAKYPPSHVAPNFGANREVIATRPAEDWVHHFWAHDVAAQIAAPFGEIYRDEQARLNGFVVEVADEHHGPCLQPGVPYGVQPPSRVRAGCTMAGAGWAGPPIGASAAATATLSGVTGQALPPLKGLKVLDLGAYLAGPFACMLLADLGADVIKVEPPAGDAMRRLERTFAGAQRGKRGLALKLGDPSAQATLDALVNWADVVHHNVRLPAARKLGIDGARLRSIKPSLVTCHISTYGPKGPRADWPGFDQLMQASCGWEIECGGAGNPPMWLRFGVGDHLAALSSVFAVLLALIERGKTGQGQDVSASLLGAMLLTQAEAVCLPSGQSTPVAALDAGQHGVSDTRRLYRCSDGWIAVAAATALQAQAFTALVGANPEAHFLSLSMGVALSELISAGVACAPALQDQLQAFLDDPDHAEAGLHAHYPHGQYGQMQQVGAFWDFGDLPLSLHRAPPALGEHSAEILAEMGLDADAIRALVDKGLVRLMTKGVTA